MGGMVEEVKRRKGLAMAAVLVLSPAWIALGCGHRAATRTQAGRPVTELGGPSVMPADQRQADFRWEKLRVDFQLENGKLVSSAKLDSPKIRMFIWPKTEQTAKETKQKLEEKGADLGEVPEQLKEARPVKLSHLAVRAGELLVVDATHKLRPALWINRLEASLEQFATRPEMLEGPTLLTLRARVQKSGELTAYVSANPFGESLSFSARVMLEGLEASELYEFLRARFDVHAPRGVMRVFIGLDASDGRLRGVIKGLVENLELEPASRGLWPWVKAEAAEFPVNFFTSAAPKDATAFVIPIEGKISNVQTEIWPTIVSTLHNALVTALGFGLGPGILPQDPNFLNRTYKVTTATGDDVSTQGEDNAAP